MRLLQFTGAASETPHVAMGPMGVIARNEMLETSDEEAAGLVASGDWVEVDPATASMDVPIFRPGGGHATEFERIRAEQGKEAAVAARAQREAAIAAVSEPVADADVGHEALVPAETTEVTMSGRSR